MPVNKVDYYGRTLIDISDSTIGPSTTLEGYVGYDADGKRFVGTAALSNLYPTSSKFNVLLSASKWTSNSESYVQDVTANVTSSDYSMVQILLTDESVLEIADFMTKVECFNGYIRVTFSELPEMDLCLEIALINGLTGSSREDVTCLNGEQTVLTFLESDWTVSEDYFVQTVSADVLFSDAVYGGILLSENHDLALTELGLSYEMVKIEISNGAATAFYNGSIKPTVDLKYVLRRFKVESIRNHYNKALQTEDTKSPHYYVDGYPNETSEYDSLYNATALFEIEPYATYTIGLVPAYGVTVLPWYEASYGIFFYDENEEYISGSKEGTFTTPVNAKYARFNYAVGSGITLDRLNDRCMLVKGDTLPDQYISYT